MGYSGAGGKLIDKKNQKQKISWHFPFKDEVTVILDINWYGLAISLTNTLSSPLPSFVDELITHRP
jgi:hypothetical protein